MKKNKQKYLLGVLINTYNRCNILASNLQKYLTQISNFNLENKIKIYIGDDNSTDKTIFLLNKLKNKYPNTIEYYSNKTNLGLAKNQFKILEKDYPIEYYFHPSDDDFLIKNALKLLVKKIYKYKPDVIFLNYKTCSIIHTKKKIKIIRNKSIIAPGIKIKRDIFFENKKDFFEFLSKQNFFSIRQLQASQSIIVINKKIIKKNLNILRSIYPNYRENTYNIQVIAWTHIPNRILIIKEPIIYITTNNRGWNYDVLKANELVKKYFNPLQKMILNRYGNLMSLKLRFLFYLSIIYTNLVPIIYKTAKLFQVEKILNKAQFGDEK